LSSARTCRTEPAEQYRPEHATTAINATADVKVASTNIVLPSAAPADTPFDVSVDAILHNNGAVSLVNTDVSYILTVPGGCTATGSTTQTDNDLSLAASVAVNRTKTWSVTCDTEGSYGFAVSATATIDQLRQRLQQRQQRR
jgi:hypothetical protein